MSGELWSRARRLNQDPPEPSLHIDIALDGHRPELRVWGEVDLANADALRDRLFALVARGGDVVVDLSGVDFLGVAGLDALCGGAELLGAHDDRLLVRSPSALTRRVIAILGLDELLPVIDEEPLPT